MFLPLVQSRMIKCVVARANASRRSNARFSFRILYTYLQANLHDRLYTAMYCILLNYDKYAYGDEYNDLGQLYEVIKSSYYVIT